ncbi:MAG TPA: hypothetical protein DIW51_18695 [Rhodospirillaceae bacterium]|nr:hypothetical protein [Magnetovibrio sp.]HCS71993.1 hypothetical protein [Rhodospirillaceae bacterium]|tara:strand:- start:1029 stop:1358 length:330 start_codon:yes stop_codon:yes gene_type:complete
MADENNTPLYQSADGPVIFTDGVPSIAHGAGVVKFYLGRFDPDAKGGNPANQAIAAQVVMPAPAFAATAAFFSSKVKDLVLDKVLTQEQVDEIGAMFEAEAGGGEQKGK